MASIPDILAKIGFPKKYEKRLLEHPDKYINIDSNRVVLYNNKLYFSKKYRLASATASLLKKVVKAMSDSGAAPAPKISASTKSPKKRTVKPKKSASPKAKSPKRSPKSPRSYTQTVKYWSEEELVEYAQSHFKNYKILSLNQYVLLDLTMLALFDVENNGLKRKEYIALIKKKFHQLKDSNLEKWSEADTSFVRKQLRFLASVVRYYKKE